MTRGSFDTGAIRRSTREPSGYGRRVFIPDHRLCVVTVVNDRAARISESNDTLWYRRLRQGHAGWLSTDTPSSEVVIRIEAKDHEAIDVRPEERLS